MSNGRAVGIGVIGIEHLHVFEMVDGLLAAGAHAVAHTITRSAAPSVGRSVARSGSSDSLAALYANWQPASELLTADEVLHDGRVDLVVVCGIPSTRAAVTCAAFGAGKDVLSAKPGVTTTDQLDAIRAAAARTGRRWWVLFSERFANPAMLRAVQLARTGAIGDVVAVEGTAPHRLNPEERPEWFFDREQSGGILVDLGTHQVDQFLAVTGADPASVSVRSAAVGATGRWGSTPPRIGFEDIGELTLQAPGVLGHHRVDFLEPDGFPTWGDTRLVITGTDGRLEVRIPVDGDGGHEPAATWITDHHGVRRDEHAVEPTWAHDLLRDLADGGERFMTRRHPFDVARLVLDAQAQATGWGSGSVLTPDDVPTPNVSTSDVPTPVDSPPTHEEMS